MGGRCWGTYSAPIRRLHRVIDLNPFQNFQQKHLEPHCQNSTDITSRQVEIGSNSADQITRPVAAAELQNLVVMTFLVAD